MRKKLGFTLIEMMVVISIIAVLAAILMPKMVYARYQAQLAACKFNERALASALENYRTDYSGYPTTLDPVVAQRYISIEPRCPSINQPYTYTTNDDYTNYTISCDGWHYKVLGQVDLGFPQYNPAVGLMEKPM